MQFIHLSIHMSIHSLTRWLGSGASSPRGAKTGKKAINRYALRINAYICVSAYPWFVWSYFSILVVTEMPAILSHVARWAERSGEARRRCGRHCRVRVHCTAPNKQASK